MFSGEQGEKMTLVGEAGELAQGVVKDVSREWAHEKLENVGDVWGAESLSSGMVHKNWASCSCECKKE